MPTLQRLCPVCTKPISDNHAEAGERLARFRGKPIHTHCFYTLSGTDEVDPPKIRQVSIARAIHTPAPEVHRCI